MVPPLLLAAHLTHLLIHGQHPSAASTPSSFPTDSCIAVQLCAASAAGNSQRTSATLPMHPLSYHPVGPLFLYVPRNHLQLKSFAVLLPRMPSKRKTLFAQAAVIPLKANQDLSSHSQLPKPSNTIPLTPQSSTLRTSTIFFFHFKLVFPSIYLDNLSHSFF